LRRLARVSEELDVELRLRFERVAQTIGVARAVRYLCSREVAVPMTAGLWKPIVYLPVWTLSGIPVQTLELVVAHELAHVRRFDYAVNLLQSLVEALYFFHPAVWWVSAKIREEREACADDLVVARGADPLVYARALSTLEESRARHGQLVLASTGGSFMRRIQRLFEPKRERPRAGWITGAVLLLGLVVSSSLAGRALADQLGSTKITLPWLPPRVMQHRALIEEAAVKNGVDANLLAIVVLVESGGDPNAKSPMGARGLMQVLPSTAERIAKERNLDYEEAKLTDPSYSLDLGAWYLGRQIARFGKERVELGVAAYNGGPEAVRTWLSGQGKLSGETERYQHLVTNLFKDESAYGAWRGRIRAKAIEAAASPIDRRRADISLAFGPAEHPIKKHPYVHEGVDLAAKDGTPVVAPLDGVVAEVTEDRERGKVLVVRHRGGIETRYHHLGSVAVRVEQKIAKGDLVGTVGATGEVTGPHVHFEVRDLGEAIDPAPFLR
jgi:murein DD-endopeptidase MepM/ murein hydrolase activator NlpD